MKQALLAALLGAFIFLSSTASGQSSKNISGQNTYVSKSAHTYLDLMINVVSTSINYGYANTSLSDYKKFGNGIQAGASFQAGITPGFSLVSELYFMRKGGKLKTNNPLTTTESSLRLNTFELPILARFHFGSFYMNGGPSIAYTISGERKIDSKSTKISFDNSPEGYKRVEASIQVGAGYEFPFRKRRIALDIRYNYGLTDITNNKEMYNRALMISVHFSKAWRTNPLGIN